MKSLRFLPRILRTEERGEEEKMISSTTTLGSHLLREIAAEECSLEDILKTVQKTKAPTSSRTGIEELDDLFYKIGAHTNQNPKINISGRYLPLLYHLLTSIISSPSNGTVAVVDLEGKFSPSHLALTAQQLKHIHVFTPAEENLAITLDSIENYMLHGEHLSHERVFKGIFVLGATGGDFNFGWRGSVRVEREEVGRFSEGGSVEEFWAERERRGEVVERKGWRVLNEGGVYRFDLEVGREIC